MGMAATSVWLENLILYLNLRSTILPVPHSVKLMCHFERMMILIDDVSLRLIT